MMTEQTKDHLLITPHILCVTFLVVIGFIGGIFLISTMNLGKEYGWLAICIFFGFFILAAIVEHHFLRNKKYKNSWWCKPIAGTRRSDAR